MRIDLLRPMADGCDDALQLLRAARTAPPVDTGLARLRTDDYASWPDADTELPQRFFEAHNELLLTSADAFPREFDAHVAATEPGRPVRDGVAAIVDQVIRGRWTTTGPMPDARIVDALSTWRPRLFPTDPHEPSAPPAPGRTAAYRIAVRPGEVLDRARAWVRRPNETFDRFISQSLRDYLVGTDVGTAERDKRAQEVHRHFRTALELARPLVAVNGATVESVHGHGPLISYKFSDIPFSGLPLAQLMIDNLVQMPDVEPTSSTRFEKALRSDSQNNRIDIFSSYGRLSPVTFSSLLAPMDRRWASCVDTESRREFWRLRRARRIPGCVPMGDGQRRAVIGGWYVARLTGRLRLPDEHPGSAVEVWHAETQRWLPFPHPLLVDRDDFRVKPDLLGAVLLSSLLALARSHQHPNLDPFLAFTTLRKLWDDTAAGREEHEPAGQLAAARHLGAFLRTGERPPGAPREQVKPSMPEERRADLLTNLEQLRGNIGQQYLAPGLLGASGGGTYSVLDRPDRLARVPLYHELAPDVVIVLGRLIEIVSTVQLTEAVTSEWQFDEALG
jgi:hypothetical protein